MLCVFVIHFLLRGVRNYIVYCSTSAKLRDVNAFVRNTVHIGENTRAKHLSQHQKGRDYFRDLGVEGSVTLKRVFA